MTITALLDDGRLVSPAVDVLTGKLTITQADDIYEGQSGRCPDCEERLASLDPYEASKLMQALQWIDKTVRYRKGVYAQGENGEQILQRVMCFCHARGYRKGFGGNPPCTQSDDIHNAVTRAIAGYYRSTLGEEFSVETEVKLTLPDPRGKDYRPDIAIRTKDGTLHTCIEYQRSSEGFENFRLRHTTRAQQWQQTIWFFDRKIYKTPTTRKARNWLFEEEQIFFECWIDDETGRLQVEEGKPVEDIQPQHRKEKPPQKCSDASVINALEDEESRNTSIEVNRAPKVYLFNEEDLGKQIEAAQERMRAEYDKITQQRAAEAEAEKHRKAWNRFCHVRDYVSVLGSRASSQATQAWSTESLDAERERLESFNPEAIAERNRRAEEMERRQAEAREKAEERARQSRQLYQEVVNLHAMLRKQYGVTLTVAVNSSHSPEKLQEEIDQLQSRISREEQERKRREEERERKRKRELSGRLLAEFDNVRHLLRREYGITYWSMANAEWEPEDLQSEVDKLNEMLKEAIRRRKELAAARESIIQCMLDDMPDLAVETYEAVFKFTREDKEAWEISLPAGVRKWLNSIYMATIPF